MTCDHSGAEPVTCSGLIGPKASMVETVSGRAGGKFDMPRKPLGWFTYSVEPRGHQETTIVGGLVQFGGGLPLKETTPRRRVRGSVPENLGPDPRMNAPRRSTRGHGSASRLTAPPVAAAARHGLS